MKSFLLLTLSIISINSMSYACMEKTFELLETPHSNEEVYSLLEMGMMDLAFCSTPMNYKKLILKSIELTSTLEFYSNIKFEASSKFDRSYQVGSEWNRENIVEEELSKTNNENYKRFVTIDDASGYYFGNNIVLTNEHVVRNKECSDLNMKINSDDTELVCNEIVKVIPHLDMALIRVEDSDVLKSMPKIKLGKHYKDQGLITFGRGFYKNEIQDIKVENSRDCRVLITNKNLGKVFSKPSVGIGCDISNGDSGSSVFDKKTGELVGLVWGNHGTNLPFSSQELRMMSNNKKFKYVLRNEVSYMIPVELLKKHLVDI